MLTNKAFDSVSNIVVALAIALQLLKLQQAHTPKATALERQDWSLLNFSQELTNPLPRLKKKSSAPRVQSRAFRFSLNTFD